MKSLLGVIAVAALILSIGFGALTLFSTSPRIDAAQQAANTAQSSANAAMVRADQAQATANEAHDLASMANGKAEAALAALQRGDAVAIVAVALGCVVLGLFGVGLFMSWDRNEQRRQELRVMQLRAWMQGSLPAPNQYYDIKQVDYAVLELPSGKR